ncbi:MAG: sulfatase-like hydrolase/transferase [Bacteroidales bacterium]|nr:sulfatase-like hydrolase/transferase [Bacteroidales bacterium]
MKNFQFAKSTIVLSGFALLSTQAFAGTSNGKPNVLWILAEDASCHISCYGEKAIQTPNIDGLANEGVRFESAFTTAAVSSPVRSAMVTGMYQTTSCSHNHRSQNVTGKGNGNTDYYESYYLTEEIPLASNLFEKAGYYTTNENISGETGKTDYNFTANEIYSGISWKDSPEGTPFFSQIQLKGGKNRKHTADTENFKLPPYYYEDEIMREDWKNYLGSWLDTDDDVRQIIADLKAAGVYANTLIFFLSDHGISHLRGKQFLYDEGTKVPLIVKLPKNAKNGTIRHDLVKHIDILPTSLAYAGIEIPVNLQGVDLFAENYSEQDFIFTTRDRCDETTEFIRSVRSKDYKYIRNFLSYRPHAQRNQYKDGKKISIHTRELFTDGKLNELQARFFQQTRPTEELYDLKKDPYEIINLALDQNYKSVLEGLRAELYQWMAETNDPGVIPEPYLEEIGGKFRNKYTAMKRKEYADIQERVIRIIEAGEQGYLKVLVKAVKSSEPSERYWAATWLGVNKAKSAQTKVEALTLDKDPSVRIAANLALFKINSDYDPIPALAKEVTHRNLIVGMYAMNAIEQTGIRNDAVKAIAEIAANSKYEFTQRFGKYLMK